MTPAARTAVAEGWVQHLREGGTTPWRRWAREAGGAPPGRGPRSVPGAAQLEVLRRLNALGPLPHRVDHVLARPGPGRGPLHLRLPADGPVAPRGELLRVASGVLADLTAQLPPSRPGRRLTGRRVRRAAAGRADAEVGSFLLDGLPVTVAEARARLAAVGLVEHRPGFSWFGARRDPGPEHVVVLVGPLDRALREAWYARVQRGAGRAWPRFVARWAGADALPASAAVDRTVAYWADRVGADHVHLVPLDDVDDPAAGPEADPAARVARVLGGPPVPPATDPPDPPDPDAVPVGEPVRLTPALVDVLRRVNVVLPFVCPQDERDPRRTALVQLMREETGRPDPPDLPDPRRAWTSTAAARLVDALQDTGCRVHGDLDVVRRLGLPVGRRVGEAEVLDAMIRMIHRVDGALGGRRNGRGGR